MIRLFQDFTGSAGSAVVLLNGKAGLWTDSRYTLQAEMQIDKTYWALINDCKIHYCHLRKVMRLLIFQKILHK